MLLKNRRGATMIEVMVAAGIVGIIATAVVNIIQMSGKSNVKMALDSDLTITVNEIYAILADPNRCKLTFAGGVDPASIVSVAEVQPVDTEGMTEEEAEVAVAEAEANPTYIATATKYEVDSDDGFGNSRFRINGYELKQLVNNDYVLEIKFQNKKILKGEVGPENIVKRINMYVEGPISAPEVCRSLSSADTDIWSRGEGTNIFYNGGNVGVGLDIPTATLHVEGDVVVSTTVTANSFLYDSDRKLKTDIDDIDAPIAKVNALRGVSFTWKDNQQHDYGFIAQEVQQLLPEVVKSVPGRETLTVDYAKIVPILVEAIKQQQEEIARLRSEVENLKGE